MTPDQFHQIQFDLNWISIELAFIMVLVFYLAARRKP